MIWFVACSFYWRFIQLFPTSIRRTKCLYIYTHRFTAYSCPWAYFLNCGLDLVPIIRNEHFLKGIFYGDVPMCMWCLTSYINLAIYCLVYVGLFRKMVFNYTCWGPFINFAVSKMPVRFVESYSYLTGVIAAEPATVTHLFIYGFVTLMCL